MIHWEVEPHVRMMVCPPPDVLLQPNINLVFGPIFTNTHALAAAGWELGMIQRTPRHVSRTRPKIWVAPSASRNQGFKIRPRACYAYQCPEEVFYDLVKHTADAFTLSSFQTKTVVVREEVVKTVEVPVATPVDPFDLLKSWCDDKVASMELPVKNHKPAFTEPDPSDTNVINLIDHLRRRDPTVAAEEMEARLQALFG